MGRRIVYVTRCCWPEEVVVVVDAVQAVRRWASISCLDYQCCTGEGQLPSLEASRSTLEYTMCETPALMAASMSAVASSTSCLPGFERMSMDQDDLLASGMARTRSVGTARSPWRSRTSREREVKARAAGESRWSDQLDWAGGLTTRGGHCHLAYRLHQ